jgi:hypothetical protein
MPELSACLVCARPDLAEIDAALDAGAERPAQRSEG